MQSEILNLKFWYLWLHILIGLTVLDHFYYLLESYKFSNKNFFFRFHIYLSITLLCLVNMLCVFFYYCNIRNVTVYWNVYYVFFYLFLMLEKYVRNKIFWDIWKMMQILFWDIWKKDANIILVSVSIESTQTFYVHIIITTKVILY